MYKNVLTTRGAVDEPVGQSPPAPLQLTGKDQIIRTTFVCFSFVSFWSQNDMNTHTQTDSLSTHVCFVHTYVSVKNPLSGSPICLCLMWLVDSWERNQGDFQLVNEEMWSKNWTCSLMYCMLPLPMTCLSHNNSNENVAVVWWLWCDECVCVFGVNYTSWKCKTNTGDFCWCKWWCVGGGGAVGWVSLFRWDTIKLRCELS